MPLIIGKLKCCFCKKNKGVLTSVHEYGIYGEVGKRIFFHEQCMEQIEMEPEKFGHINADMAIKIHDLMNKNSKQNECIIEQFVKNNELLQRKHFERMMPKRNGIN